MARYRIYYLKEPQRQNFRNSPPAAEPPQLKRKDYEPGGDIEASSPYAAWKQMQSELQEGVERRPISVGDALEADSGILLVCKYVGFEEARWWTPPPASANLIFADPAPGPLT